MIEIPVTSNSIRVSLVRKGCCKTEFDSTYPVHLNGIISQDEYQKSLARINGRMPSSILLTFVWIIYAIIMFLAILIYIGYIGSVDNRSRRYFSSYSVALISVSISAGIFLMIGNTVVSFRHRVQLRKAVAQESMRHSTGSPIPCSWRLETTTAFIGNLRQLVINIVIDIGRPIVQESQINYTSQDVNELQTLCTPLNFSEPPPDSSQSAVICTCCGVLSLDLTANFCSSCGQALNKN